MPSVRFCSSSIKYVYEESEILIVLPLEKPEKHIVTLCNGTGCHVKGGDSIIDAVEKKIADNGARITLEKVRCLGCCDLSPAVMIDGEVFGGVEAQAKLEAILNE